MNQVIVYIALVLAGACLGSFAGATVWRLRAKQLEKDKKNKESYSPKEYDRLKKLLNKSSLQDRSVCLECSYKLRWYDLIPVVSWLSLKGKCRNCKHPIGTFELAIELGMIVFFVLSYLLWPGGIVTNYDAVQFVLWLIAGVIMGMLFAYDSKWYLLPDSLTIALAVVGLAMVGVTAAETGETATTLLNAVYSVGILAGIYAIIFFASKGRWVGFGDVKLGIGLGLLLMSWELAFIALFLANLLGCLIVIPLMLAKKLKRSSHIAFGPLLISGTILAWFFGWQILDWYLSAFSAF